jgi:uncharacterized Ntn-hydrolase superfamily protein
MAITTANKVLVDGEKLAVIHSTGLFTATTGEETDAVKVDVSNLTPAPSLVKVQRIWYTNSVDNTRLEFDGTTADGLLVTLSNDNDGYMDFRSFGGIQNNATDPTGDITLTTAGTAAAGDGYSIVIEVSKS